jgi:ssDNA-binding Zn-finger/Zn-ribbon topoisomerase 1
MPTLEEKPTAEETYDAGDQCGRCGCTRRNHTPGCVNCPKCHSFSTPKPQGRKTVRKR